MLQIVQAGRTERRLAGAALSRAHLPRHVRERLGHDDHARTAHSHIGQRAETGQDKRGSYSGTWPASTPARPPWPPEGRFPTRRAVLHPTTKHVVLAALRGGRLPQLQELHPGAGERHSCPLRPRRLLRRLGREHGMAAPVFGRMGGSHSHGPLRHKPGVGVRVASLARPHRRRIPARPLKRPTSCTPLRLVREIEPEPAPNGPRGMGHGRVRPTTKTTRPCQTRHSSRS